MTLGKKNIDLVIEEIRKSERVRFGIGDLHLLIRRCDILENWQIKNVILTLEAKGILKGNGRMWEVIDTKEGIAE